MPLIIPDAERVSILGNQADGPWAAVYGIATDTATEGATAQSIAQAVLDSFVLEVLPHLTDSVSVTRATYVDLSSESGDTGEVLPTSGPSLVGGVTVDPLPPQCTYLIKILTTGGRSVRSGRSFWPGVRSDEVDDRGDITSGTVLTMTTAAEDFAASIESLSGATLGVIHRPSVGSPSITDMTQVNCEVAIATQRRRLRR